jgi:isopentenyldiphosphate isomerase
MINNQELLFTVDENNEPVEPKLRSVVHSTGAWHRKTDIWVYNSKGSLLCHKRSLLKDSSPGLWDTTFGGHVLAGEDTLDNAVAELKEESSISANKADLEYLILTRDNRNGLNRQFRYNYIYRWEGKAEDLELEADEVEQAIWFNIEELCKLRENEPDNWTHPPQIAELLDIIRRRLVS